MFRRCSTTVYLANEAKEAVFAHLAGDQSH